MRPLGKWPKRILIGGGSVAFVLIAAFLIFMEITFPSMCDDLELIRKKSPLHNLDAVVTCFSCGAMDSCYWYVNIVPTGQKEFDNSSRVLGARHASIETTGRGTPWR
jgi:hypothetical protein